MRGRKRHGDLSEGVSSLQRREHAAPPARVQSSHGPADRIHGEDARGSVDGGAALPLSSGSRTPVDLSSLFVMPDLGASGVVGSRRVGALPSAETRVTGSHAECGSEPPPPPPRARDRAARIRLSDGTQISFASAAALDDPNA